MAFPPHAWTYEALTSTLLALLEFKGKPKASITYPTAQSIPDNTWTTLTNNATNPTVVYDTDSMVDLANRRIKITSPGWYVPVASVVFAANSSGMRKVAVRRNGVLLHSTYIEPDTSTQCPGQVTAGPQLCAANDYFDIQVLQASGGALSTYSGGDGTPSLSVYMVDSSTS